MRRSHNHKSRNDPATSGPSPGLKKYHHSTAPGAVGGHNEAANGRYGSPKPTATVSSRTLPAIPSTPMNASRPDSHHGPVSNGASFQHANLTQRSHPRSSDARGAYRDTNHPPTSNPHYQVSPSQSRAVPSMRSNDGAGHDIRADQVRGQPTRPAVAIPETRSHSSTASPVSAFSTYGSQLGDHSYTTLHQGGPLAPSVIQPRPGNPPTPLPGPDAMTHGPAINSGPSSRTTQYMTVETSNGQMQIPMDVQGASRVADEKRRRNAGASARFRARRKEKEQASSREIDELKRRISDLSEDREFYRQERDVMAAALYSSGEGSRLFPRPSSPRLQRTLVDGSSQSEGGTESPSMQHFEERGEQGGAGSMSRRRLETPPRQYMSYAGQSQPQYPPYQQGSATLPPIQGLQHSQSTGQLPQIRSVSYPGFAPTQSGPSSPWQSTTSHSQTHSRSHSSTLSYQSGN